MSTFLRLALHLAPAAVLASALTPTSARGDQDDGGPWSRGHVSIGLGAGVSGSRDVTIIGAAIQGSYFVANGVALGAEVDETYLAWRPVIRSKYPHFADTIPSSVLRVTPTLRLVPLRSPHFSPFILAGAGPTFLNHNGGTLAHWIAMPGVMIAMGPRAFLSLGVRFTDDHPPSRCTDAFTYKTVDGTMLEIEGFCGFSWSPRIGLSFAF
ncbi:MAG: hypothetical protein V3V08_26085 [Nannocystaceae bacterium]